jgi:site-specific DNA-adenine methylase
VILEERAAPLSAPFPWAGGKSGIAAEVWDRFGKVENFVEPFAGTLAALLSNPFPPAVETANDADSFIANFFRAVTADPEEVAYHADWPVHECVPAGTMISTPSGEIPVESVTAGTAVYGYEGGRVVVTTVAATSRGIAADIVGVGPLAATPNHPVWTRRGYIPAGHLLPSDRVMVLRDAVVTEIDLSVLELRDEDMGDLRAGGPANLGGPLRGNHLPGEGALPGAPVTGGDGRANASGLLDSKPSLEGPAPGLPAASGRNRRLAGSREGMDSQLSAGAPDEPDERRRGGSRIHPHTGAAREVVSRAQGPTLRPWQSERNEGEEAFRRGEGEDIGGRHWTEAHAGGQGKDSAGGEKARYIGGDAGKDGRLEARTTTEGGAQGSHCRLNPNAKTSGDGRVREVVPVGHGRGGQREGQPGHDQPSHSQRVPVQGGAVEVFNFQSGTGNYFANGVLVHNCDLHARHAYLVKRVPWLTERLMGDPAWCDPKLAGWWVWGICAWIGSGWCSGKGPWVESGGGRLMHRSELGADGPGVNVQLPRLGNRGRGINRPGVRRKLPNLTAGYGGGTGIHGAGVADLGGGSGSTPGRGQGLNSGGAPDILSWFQALQARLRRVRFACGDWSRVLTPSVTYRHGLTGVFLDPPYINGDMEYSAGDPDPDLHEKLLAWCRENQDNPQLRIALCGHEGDYDLPGWEILRWKARGGYGNQGKGADGESLDAEDNRHKEVIHFNASCLAGRQGTLFG